MAINAATVWEIRTTGSQNNGGGFYNRNPGTSVDYSQQDSPQLSLSDVTVDTTTLTSATGGFTSAMVGNICRIYGGGATAGWYEITAVTDSNTATIDRTAGSGTNNTVNVGGAFKIGGSLDNDFFKAAVAGNTIYIKNGTYTLGETILATVSGTYAAPICCIGYNSSRGDNPTGSNRPLLDGGSSYYFNPGSYWAVLNLRFTSSYTATVSSGANTFWYNCSATNTAALSGRNAFHSTNSGIQVVKCTGSSTCGTAFYLTGSNSYTLYCRAYSSSTGYNVPLAIGCVAEGCTTTGILVQANTYLLLNNTIYGCTTGITSEGYYATIINNIVSNCTTGLSATSDSMLRTIVTNNNCLYNTTDVSNVTLNSTNLTATNPLLNNPSSGDFTLQSGSPCFDAGMQPDSMIGL